MDRRSLLAFALSMLVIAVFNVFFFPKPKPRVGSDGDSLTHIQTGDPVVTGSAPARAPDPSPVLLTIQPASGAGDSTFDVRVGRAEARFATRGGGLVSWRRVDFEGPEEEPVQFVRTGPEPHVAIDLGESPLDLSGTLFAAAQERLPDGGVVVTFRAGIAGGLQVTKRYTLPQDTGLVDFVVEVGGVPLSAAGPTLDVGWTGGLPQAERDAKADQMMFGAIVSLGEDIQRIPAGKFKKEKEKRLDGAVHWVAARNKYFLAGLVPIGGDATVATVRGDAALHQAGASVQVPLTSGGTSQRAFKLYLGPLDYWKLKDVGYGLEKAVDLGWKIILPLSQALLWLLVQGFKIIPNYGVVIILLSALTKIIFYPMTKSSMRSMREMQKLQPEMERLRKRFKDDPARMNQEVMNLYKTHRVNPLGGCLPMLLQMPVFIALYTVLANSVELRHAAFVGWISDLSAPDTLFRIGGFSVHVLPLLMSATMFWQQKLTPTDPRQAMMTYIMPVMMLFFLYGFPSGLSLYWTVINVLSVGQQYLINRETSLSTAKAA